jgi:alpha-D-ribose 1-methylphosphonate 5-phosphate C-P lyase
MDCLTSGAGVVGIVGMIDEASDVHDVKELDRTPALCALDDSKLNELLVDSVGDVGVSCALGGWSTKEKVLFVWPSLWM